MAKAKKDSETELPDSLTLPAPYLNEGAGDPENVPDNYVPEGYETLEEYLEDLREDYQLDLQADEENRTEAVSDKKFAAGDQWDPIVLETRRGLPTLVINSVPQFTAQVVGDWRTNRNAIKVVPAENGDTDTASVLGDLVRAIEMKSRASRVYDTAFESAIQCGDGAYRIAVEYAKEDVFDQEICVRPIDDALSVVWDRMSIDPTGRDANHCFVDDQIPRREFERRWKNAEPSTLSDNVTSTLRLQGWLDSGTVRVTEHWRMIERKKLLCLFKDGSIHEMSGDKMDELIEAHGDPVRTRVAPCSYAQMHLVTGWKILAGPYEYRLTRLPIIRMTGRVVNVLGKRVRYGLVRFMKDPVRLKNFWRSVAAEQLGYAPKAQWLAPESAVEGREDAFRRAHLSRDPLLTYNDDATEPPQRIMPPPIEAALLNAADMNAQDMKDVTGIHDASLGVKSNETSGRAIYARQREGDIANLTYHDNGNASILEGGDVINQLIPQIYDGTRIIRIIGEDESTKFVRINDPYDPESPNLATGNYDVALSTGASYTTRRVEAAEAMMQAVQAWPQLIQVAGDLVAKAQDWPGSQELAERLKKTIPPQFLDEDERENSGMPMITPEMLQELQTQGQELMQENQQLKGEAASKDAELKIKAFEAQTARLKAVADIQAKGEELKIKAIDSAFDIKTYQDIKPDK